MTKRHSRGSPEGSGGRRGREFGQEIPVFQACSGTLWVTGLELAGDGVVADLKPAWTLKNKSPDRAWRPGLYHLDPRGLGAGIIWLPR